MNIRHVFLDEDEYGIGNKLEDFEFLQYLGGCHLKYFAKVKSKINQQIYVMEIVKNISEEKYIDIESKINLIKLLDHDNIMKYYSSFVEGNNYYLLMEYAENGNLKKYYKIHKLLNQKIPEEKLVDIYFQSKSGIKYLHDIGFIHRNVNLSSIYISKDGKIKIGGFEYLIKLGNTNDKISEQKIKNLYNCPNILNGNQYGIETDIYSLECIFSQLRNFQTKNIILKENDEYKIIPQYECNNSKYPINGNIKQFEEYILQSHKEILNLYQNNINQNSNIKVAYISIFDIFSRYILNNVENKNILFNNLNKPVTNSIFMHKNPMIEINDYNINYLRKTIHQNEKSFSKFCEIPIFALIKFLIKKIHIENNEYHNDYTELLFVKNNESRTDEKNSENEFNKIFGENFKSLISSDKGFYGIYKIERTCLVCREKSF